MKHPKKINVIKMAGNFIDKLTKHRHPDTKAIQSAQLSDRLKEEVSEMQMHQFSADNSEHRMQWSVIGTVYNTYYHMIETMIIGEMKSLRQKYLYVAHQLDATDDGETIFRIIIKPHRSNKIYQAEIMVGVSVIEDRQVECTIQRMLSETDQQTEKKIFTFNETKNYEPMTSRMMASANMRMAIHDTIKDIDRELDTLMELK